MIKKYAKELAKIVYSVCWCGDYADMVLMQTKLQFYNKNKLSETRLSKYKADSLLKDERKKGLKIMRM